MPCSASESDSFVLHHCSFEQPVLGRIFFVVFPFIHFSAPVLLHLIYLEYQEITSMKQ
jgi:hypothetical protein